MVSNKSRVIKNSVVKDQIIFLEMASDKQDAITWFAVDLAPNGGNDLHYHDTFEETFIAVEGSLGITLEKEEILLKEGESLTVPIGVLHRFYNPNNHKIKFETKVNPASRNLEEFLQIIYGLARDGKVNKKSIPTNPLHIGVLSLLGETSPPKKSLLHRLGFVFRWLGRRAEKKGVLAALRTKYVKY